MPLTHDARRRWRRHMYWTVLLLVCWFVMSFGVVLLARVWEFSLFGSPFTVWIAGQGAMLVFLAIVWFYAHLGDKHDRAIAESAVEPP